MKHLTVIGALLLLAVIPLQAQSQRQSKPEPIIFTPQWTAQAQFAGYYVAKEKGFYDEEGIGRMMAYVSDYDYYASVETAAVNPIECIYDDETAETTE